MSKKTEILTLNQVPVRIDAWGGVLPSDIQSDPTRKPKDLILMIPGNPGVTSFYDEFLTRLHEKTKKNVWIISHGGHIRDLKNDPPLRGNEDLFNLRGQIEQKKEFFEKYLKNIKIYLVGHSIGCKMILDALKNIDNEIDVEKCYFLFPTIERMVETPNGKVFTFFYRYMMWLILISSFIFVNLPHLIQVVFFKLYCLITGMPQSTYPGIIDYIHPDSLEKSLFLADDEMQNVRELDHEALDQLKKKVKLYYGTTDGWVPLNYYEQLIHKHKDIDAQVCNQGLEHAFVLRQSVIVADLVSGWIMAKTN